MRVSTELAERASGAGFETTRVGRALLVARPERVDWGREAIDRHGSLHAAALAQAILHLKGRGSLPVMTNPAGEGPPWVVRRYRRGGWMRPLGDRHLRAGAPRCLREVMCSTRVQELGIRTPRVVAGGVYPAGAYYRADLVTEYVFDARELADVLLGTADSSVPPADEGTRTLALSVTSRLIDQMARGGIRHPDLNARNILVAPTAEGAEAVLLDLDRCVFGGASRPGHGTRLRRRLVRSLRKLQQSRVGVLTEAEIAIVGTENEAS